MIFLKKIQWRLNCPNEVKHQKPPALKKNQEVFG